MTQKASTPFRPPFSFLLLLSIVAGTVSAQTGVTWFGDSSSAFVNNRIISIKEGTNGDLYLLGKATDRGYKNIHPYWAVCDKSGKMRSQKTVATENSIFDLNNFTVCGEDKFRIWGTEIVNNRATLFLGTVNAAGEMPGTDAMLTNTATFCGDVCQVDAQHAILAKTVQSSKTGKYHISFYKYNVQTDQQVWYKTLDAEGNEEASKIFVLKDGSIILLGKLYNDMLSSYKTLIYKVTSAGEPVWRKELDAYPVFHNHGIAEGKNKSLVYVCSIGEEKDASGSTKMIALDSTGKVMSTTELKDIRANGILGLKDGNFFVYGCHFQVAGHYIISKACYRMFSPELEETGKDEMGMFDGPDAYLPNLAMTAWPTASDFITAIQLSDGRIACAGRVYMPEETHPDKIILSARVNKAFLVLMDEKGKFRP